MPTDANRRTPWAVQFDFYVYLEVVDWSGRAIRPYKRGLVPEMPPKIHGRLGIESRQITEYSARLVKVLGAAVGAPEKMIDLFAKRDRRYLWGMGASRRQFLGDPAAQRSPARTSGGDSPVLAPLEPSHAARSPLWWFRRTIEVQIAPCHFPHANGRVRILRG